MKAIKSFLDKIYLDKTFLKFAVVGVINTIVGSLIMFGFYNILRFDYWSSSAANYFFTSILSYFLNKYYTFQNKDTGILSVLKFAVNIIICYVLAYGCAKPLVGWALSGFAKGIQDNVSMFVGMVFFVIANYFGQRLIVFATKEKDGSKK